MWPIGGSGVATFWAGAGRGRVWLSLVWVGVGTGTGTGTDLARTVVVAFSSLGVEKGFYSVWKRYSTVSYPGQNIP